MVIALKEVVSSDPDASIWMRAIVLAVVAVLITILVYGVVALIVKMDDVGLHLAEKPSKVSQRVGLALVAAMPRLLAAISFIGTLAMLWVGGHIFLVSLYEIGGHDGLLEGTGLGDVLHAPYDLVHHWEVDVHDAIGGALGAPRRLAAQHRASPRSSDWWSAAIVLAVLHASASAADTAPSTDRGRTRSTRRDRRRSTSDEAAAEDSPNR